MYMVRLIYASKPDKGICEADLENILEVSRRLNKRDSITGILCYSVDSFLQWIEGPRDAVNALYSRLVKDSRHSELLLLEYGYIHRRDFTDWSMAAVAAKDIPLPLLERYAVLESYDPFLMSGDAARNFLLEVSSTQRGQVDTGEAQTG